MQNLIDLRTRRQKLIGRLEPSSLQLHVRWRDEECTFDLPALVRQCGVLVRVLDPENNEDPPGQLSGGDV